MKRLLLALVMVLVPALSYAQTVVIGPTSTFQWTDQAGDVPTAMSFIVNAVIDGAAPKILTPVTCVAATVVTVPASQNCSILATTALPMGTHTVTVTNTLGTLVSAPSVVFSYTTILIPIPSNPRVVALRTIFGTKRRIVIG